MKNQAVQFWTEFSGTQLPELFARTEESGYYGAYRHTYHLCDFAIGHHLQFAQGAGFLESPALEVAAQQFAAEPGQDLIGRRIGFYQILSLVLEAWARCTAPRTPN